ncbi:VanW family protein [Pseudoflavonifractor phocaeensis]|uniref:VanW family protein n=1 Tax=Pseudoflavonifractor phocaeensis TaxID=1870988 RepID=UPI00195D4AE8|nr:VanW family protein [Pseudoflavonifractor phocaeensis]MBM6870446.1 VanW family protein [Pseudoflavonifractor phocaeensis]
MGGRKLMCQYGPVFYQLSLWKEGARKALKDMGQHVTLARRRQREELPVIVKGHRSPVLRRLAGVDMALQKNKETNLGLALSQIDGLVVAPGETFSFWALVGAPTARRGYREGLVIANGDLRRGVGGGLCQLANLIHYLVLHSPMEVAELHHHSDALFPDDRRRVPFGTGTSIFYPHVDYRFRNTTDQPVQLRLWLSEGDLCGELRSERPFPCRYRLVEEDAHFVNEGEAYYRVSRVYRRVIHRESGRELGRELLLRNHSRVLYDPALIPPDQLR